MKDIKSIFNGEAYGFAHMQPDGRTADAIAASEVCAALDNHFTPVQKLSAQMSPTKA